MEMRLWYFVTTDTENCTDIEIIEHSSVTHAKKQVNGAIIGVFEDEKEAAYVAYYAHKAIEEYRLLQTKE